MSQYDCPDYEHIVTIVTGSGVTDCPDWQEQVVGPGGGTIPGVTSSNDWAPGDFGLKGWNINPFVLGAGAAQSIYTGTLQLFPIKIATTGTITNIGFTYFGSGVTYTAHENFVGIYTTTFTNGVAGTFTQQASSAAGALETALAFGPGMVFTALSSPYSVTAGTVIWAALLVNWTGATDAYYWTLVELNDYYPSNSTTFQQITSCEWAGPYTTLPASVTFNAAANPIFYTPFFGVY